MAQKFPEYKFLNMPAIGEEIAKQWMDEDTFKKSVDNRNGATPFVFFEGPPSANGMPGIHHVISRTLKDLVCRYKTMQGFRVSRKAGWDTHGLPVELGVEKELGITKEDIGAKISVEDYNAKCREAVMRYKKEWEDITTKMGYWVDLEHPYVTFETDYIETLWWCLKQLYNKGLLYKSVSIQPYSPAAGTGLSSHELNQPGTYKNVKDTTVAAMFKVSPTVSRREDRVGLADLESEADIKQAAAVARAGVLNLMDGGLVYFLAWTTTPWTLPSNCALTVGPNIDYVLVKTFNPYTHQPCKVILAKLLIGKWFKWEGENGDFEAFNAEMKLIPWQILAEFKGRDLEGIRYEQLIPLAGNTADQTGGDPWRVILGDFVTTEDGTGIVHTAPAFGADDFRVGKANNIGILTMVDKEGKFVSTARPRHTEGMSTKVVEDLDLSGRYVKNYKSDSEYRDVDIDIAVMLKQQGKAFKVEKYEHTYPHCWRTDKPIIYYPLDAWFIRTTAVKDRMIALNKTINWKPKATGEGRFGNWLENMVDWNLSRSRYWGTPLPVWVSEDGAETKCIGSIDELQREITHANSALGINQFLTPSPQTPGDARTNRDSFSKEGHAGSPSSGGGRGEADLHKPWVDQIILATKDGKPMRREPDLIDVWFDSGAMPYAQWGLPKVKEGHEVTPEEMMRHIAKMEGVSLPLIPPGKRGTAMEGAAPSFGGGQGAAASADFIAEGVDQTRGWFYTLHALGVMLFDQVAYKTVVSNGLVLDKHGNKMSKRIGNVVDPFETINEYSADATRWYLITNASPWDNLKFDLAGIQEVQRKLFGTLYNTYQFFALYANVDSFIFKEKYIPLAQRPEMDRWILSSLQSLVNQVIEAMDDYEPTQAGRAVEAFVDEHLSNWYVRLNRRRFWKGTYEADKISAYQTLYECLETLSLLIAPIVPFFADWLYRGLNGVSKRNSAESVHLADFPGADKSCIDKELEEKMQLAQDASSLLLSLRKRANIKVRQPLQKAFIPALNPEMSAQLHAVESIIRHEANIKEIGYSNDNQVVIKKRLKPDFKALGARLGGDMKAAANVLSNLPADRIAALEQNGQIDIDVSGQKIPVNLADVTVVAEDVPGWMVAAKGALTVALDITITPELQAEGVARELINRVQSIRKNMGLELTDRIIVKFQQKEGVSDAILAFKDYICAEILADTLEIVPNIDAPLELDINDQPCFVSIIKN